MTPDPQQQPAPRAPDLVCLSHLRWDFVYQRPQHLLSRFARERRVFFVEEPLYDTDTPYLAVDSRADGLHVVVPHLVRGRWSEAEGTQRELLDTLLREHRVSEYLLWYYTPMALPFTDHLEPLATVYDCMDELSAFRGAPPAMLEHEAELLRRADLVFTGGQSLYEAKRDRHPGVHLFPSSIDAAHFARARNGAPDLPAQAALPHPRLGFFGVIDERMDLELLAGVADARPDWQLVMVGPVVKIDAADLPRRPNLHFPGGADYAELPAWIAGWDVALIPFARNESTRFVSPTKTPEYLAAGKPVVSTPIRDVVRPYGDAGLVRIAGTVPEFVAAVEAALEESPEARREWLERVDAFLAGSSWDLTWRGMVERIDEVVAGRDASLHAAD
ncbi:MAG TPA: glycosyltransferase family 1 protein [Longimicrobiaceae bacterium]|nr:glycosyltransferase family 1 protein [Longimicrobiaceae bacterium]